MSALLVSPAESMRSPDRAAHLSTWQFCQFRKPANPHSFVVDRLQWRECLNMNPVRLLTTDQNRSVFTEAAASMRAYSPYGYHVDQGGPLLGFTGQPRDANTGCYLLGNGRRAFNPRLMRFHSPDDTSPFSAGGLNAYAYCGGDPINRSDPSGRSWLDWLVQGIFAVGNTVTIGAGVSFRGNHHGNPSAGVVSRTQSLANQYIPRALAIGGSLGLVARGAAAGAMLQPARGAMWSQLGNYANAASGTLVVSATLIYEGWAAYRWWNQAAAAGRRPGYALMRGAYEATSLDLVVGAARHVGRGVVSAGRTVVGAAGGGVNAVTGAVGELINSIANRWRARTATYDVRHPRQESSV